MKNDSLKQFVSLQSELQRERNDLVGRLAEIERVLGSAGAGIAAAAAPARRGRPPGRPPAVAKASAAPRGRRAQNALSLREVVGIVTKSGPLSRQEILKGVLKHGYVFKAKDPMNSLNTLLYTAPGIKNYGGKFGPA